MLKQRFAGGLVKNQQARMAGQGAGNRQPLLFAARKLHAPLADDPVQPFGRGCSPAASESPADPSVPASGRFMQTYL